MESDLADKRVEEFYFLARTVLVKDESNLDRFDRVSNSLSQPSAFNSAFSSSVRYFSASLRSHSSGMAASRTSAWRNSTSSPAPCW
jgi:hypothetical protein